MKIEGQIERITYSSEETGYTVAQVKIPERRELITVVGNLLASVPGETLQMEGEWTRHSRYGDQFKVTECRTKVPATVEGIRRYLGSGLISGIGPKMADRIVDRFGADTLSIIEKTPDRLSEVNGIGLKKIAGIKKAWKVQHEIRDLMLFLSNYGLGSTFAAKIFKHYGNRAIALLRQNPYRMAADIFGIGFITADRIAQKIGFQPDAPERVEAGLLYVLRQASEEGHLYYPETVLVSRSAELLDVEKDRAHEALVNLKRFGKVLVEETDIEPTSGEATENAVYLPGFHRCEVQTADRIAMLLKDEPILVPKNPDVAIARVQEKLGIQLAENQIEALSLTVKNKMLIITGGPGTGKTTLISAILKLFGIFSVKALLAAPTGRAAKRMEESTGREARTIHRLLEYNYQHGGFQRNEMNPLVCGLLIIDEASMVDAVLMNHLLRALPSSSRLVLVGDVHQLPPVGPGNVLKDFIDSGCLPVIRLNRIFRQAKTSQIVVNAHRVNTGRQLRISQMAASGPTGISDFYFIRQEDPEKVLNTVLELARERIPSKFGFHPVRDIQVITPMHRGVVGAENLNRELQNTLNPSAAGWSRGNVQYRIGDKVMQIRNNYEKNVYNGDIGTIQRIDKDMQQIVIRFEDRSVPYDLSEADEAVLAYAISVHKSQGSEYPAIIFPLVMQHYLLLQRNLVYTGITRGKKLVVMVGSSKALSIAVGNNRIQNRFTRLRQRLTAVTVDKGAVV